ncbi:dockerin type I domain-containing protein [Sodaliphilus sp.]|uniref:dockerin type I domain-containing protein n=1 Tax=Sodaliphilus sp. TaxID=2815818 RepID=UPI00388DE7E8
MKKFLLLASMAVTAMASAWATTDGKVYEPVNDIKIKNLWIMDRVHTPAEFNASPLSQGTYARMATMKDNVVYVSRSGAQLAVTEENDSILQCVVYRFDALTGQRLADLPLTLDGKPYGTKEAASLSANNIGTDHFGHMWIAPYSSEVNTVQKLYQLDVETGELTLVTELEKGDALARIDYIDLVGDITREEAMCTIMGMGSQVATVYRWQAEQGDDFEGGFEGDTYIDFTAFYPETVTLWGYAPYVKICLGEDEETMYAGELFWLDGFQTAPALYDFTGEMITTFEPVAVDNPELVPEAGTNGVTEFSLEGRNFIAYSMAQYSGDGHGCQANICELGPDMMLEGMTHYWTIPADSLGKVSDSGTRIHCLNAQKGVDAQGNEEITLLTYKCYNGIGVYKIGKNVGGDDPDPTVPGDVNGDGAVDINDANILINVILGKDTADKYNGRADVDGNGSVDVKDSNIVINKILGK